MQEAEVGELLEPRALKSAWAIQQDPFKDSNLIRSGIAPLFLVIALLLEAVYLPCPFLQGRAHIHV
jgi:hypothetical protein